MHEWVNKTIFSTEVLIPKSQGQDSACPWTAFLFLVLMTLPSTYKFKQALVKAPYPWPLAPSGQGLPWSCPGLPLVKDLHCLGVTPPHTCSNLFNLDLTVQGPPDIFKLVQLGPHCTGTPWTFSNLFIMKHIQFTSGRLASFWNAFLLCFF